MILVLFIFWEGESFQSWDACEIPLAKISIIRLFNLWSIKIKSNLSSSQIAPQSV